MDPGAELIDHQIYVDFPDGSEGKESVCNAGDPGSIPGHPSDALEKGMNTHSSIVAWRIPRTEESGGL